MHYLIVALFSYYNDNDNDDDNDDDDNDDDNDVDNGGDDDDDDVDGGGDVSVVDDSTFSLATISIYHLMKHHQY